MSTLAVVDTRWNTPYAQQTWQNHANCLEVVCAKAASLASKVLLLGPGQTLHAEKHTTANEIYALLKEHCDDTKNILYMYADEPFCDLELCQKMLKNHEKYLADFSFAEGYPQGLTPLVISAKILPDLLELAEKETIIVANAMSIRNFFFQTIKQDLNRFAIETEISPVDVRALRLTLNYANKNNSLICQNILQTGASNAAAILEIVQKKPELLWGCPAYYNVQISSDCPQKCGYCPYSFHRNFGKSNFISLTQLKDLLVQAKELSGEAVISLSYMGESALHPEFPQLMEEVLAIEGFSLHIETSGIGWSDAAWETLLSLDSHRVSLVLSLDSHEETLYQKVRGEGFAEAIAFAERCLKDYRQNTWIQSVRQKSLELSMESFYRYFQEKGAQVIIQKYDNFCHLLPDEKVTDIAPLTRNICWALKREMTIQVDGNVHLCRADLAGNIVLGNAFTQNLQDIWQKMNEYRLQHAHKKYPKICETCDEYYIFNF